MAPNDSSTAAVQDGGVAPNVAVEEPRSLHLPTGIVTAGDARKLYREIMKLQDTIQTLRLRSNQPLAKLPRFGRMLEEFAAINRLNFLLPQDRDDAQAFITDVIRQAPVLRISFATETSRRFTTELIVWLRSNYDRRLLLDIGLEPTIAAGCIVRTKNKMFDFSLINHLKSQRSFLTERLIPPRPQIEVVREEPAHE